MIPRREVLAFIALNTTEEHAPHAVYVAADAIRLTVDTGEAVRFWAGIFGHTRSLPDYEHTRDDGSSYTNYLATETGWRGLRTSIEATVERPAPAPLDDDTREQLAALAEPTATQEPA